jgi:PAS domain S-box-containing protein
MLTGVKTVEIAVKAMKLGAYDFLSKPLNHELLLKTLEKAVQHNRLAQKLADSEEKFKVLSEAAWEGIVILQNGTVVEANEPFLDMFGYARADLSGELHIESILCRGSLEVIDNLAADSAKVSCTLHGRKKGGAEIPIEVKSRVIGFRNVSHRVLAIRDLTERVRTEEANLDLQKKLSVASKLNALGLMAGAVAHDLNNILTAIVSYPELVLRQMNASDKHYTQIQKIQAAGKRAAAVVSDLVAITRGSCQQKTVENINTLILNYLETLEHSERLTTFPNVVLETSLQPDVMNVCCSSQHIHKLLLNLIGNAMEAAPADGRVHVITENCRFLHPLQHEDANEKQNGGQYIKLIVADNGPGIAGKDVEHIFDPFYSTKVMGKSGTGLGLSVVWNIVQNHDGWIEVKDNSPGALFEVYLPATFEEVCPVVELPAGVMAVQGQGEKILIVDDQTDQNEILEKALTQMGYCTASVTSGEDAILYLSSNRVDLLLMDMIMGEGLNGRETLEIILKDSPDQKVIVISGYAKRDELEKTRALGVSHFLEKPVTLREVGQAVHRSLTGN